jgi:DNA-binding IclR family transcriptional regulator
MKRAQKREHRERQVLEAFRRLPDVLDRPVSLEEVARSIGVSRALVHRHAHALIAAGLLRAAAPGAARTWRVVDPPTVSK